MRRRTYLTSYQDGHVDARLHDAKNNMAATSRVIGKSVTAVKSYIKRKKSGKVT